MSLISISIDEYSSYKKIADSICSEISSQIGIPSRNVHWDNFKQLLKEKYNVIFFSNADYTGIAAKKVAGSITCDGYNTIIEYNNTYTQTTERKHYTIVHEGVHFYCDLNKGQTSKSISDSSDHTLVQPTNYAIEKRAEVTASLIMCSDFELEQNLKQGMTFSENCDFFQMSKSAMWYRIKNYLQFNLGIPQKEAKKLVDAYRYGEKKERSSFLNLLLLNWRNLKDALNLHYCFGYKTKNNILNSWKNPFSTKSQYYQLNLLINSLFEKNGLICKNCGVNLFNKKYCPICGSKLNQNKNTLNYYLKDNQMKEIALNKNNIAITCPICGLTNKEQKAICANCGAFLQNVCTGVTLQKYTDLVTFSPNTYKVIDSWIVDFGELDRFNGAIPGQGIINGIDAELKDEVYNPYPHEKVKRLPGYARFCPDCGCISSFYLENILKVE